MRINANVSNPIRDSAVPSSNPRGLLHGHSMACSFLGLPCGRTGRPESTQYQGPEYISPNVCLTFHILILPLQKHFLLLCFFLNLPILAVLYIRWKPRTPPSQPSNLLAAPQSPSPSRILSPLPFPLILCRHNPIPPNPPRSPTAVTATTKAAN